MPKRQPIKIPKDSSKVLQRDHMCREWHEASTNRLAFTKSSFVWQLRISATSQRQKQGMLRLPEHAKKKPRDLIYSETVWRLFSCERSLPLYPDKITLRILLLSTNTPLERCGWKGKSSREIAWGARAVCVPWSQGLSSKNLKEPTAEVSLKSSHPLVHVPRQTWSQVLSLIGIQVSIEKN